ncbi:MAG: DUF952 domain-containing protein [Pyrinomonadaceae bacterium]
MKIYHIVLPEIWDKLQNEEFYEAASLRAEGFIHCSFASQIAVVLDRYYKGVPEVLILEIETDKLTSKLVEEPSTGGEIYPHIYGPINREAVVAVEKKVIGDG